MNIDGEKASVKSSSLRVGPVAPMRKNLTILTLVATVLVCLLSFNARLDTTLWRATRWLMGDQQPYSWAAVKLNPATHPHAPWWRTTPPLFHSQLYHHMESTWRALRDVGVPAEVLFIMLLVAVYDPARWRGGAIVLGSILGAGAVSEFFKSLCGRIRPIGMLPGGHLNDGLNVWIFGRGLHTQKDLSFPSGHAVVAFAMAAALTYLSPRGKWLFLMVAWLTAFSRVVMQAHFYSDIIAGGTIGWFCGFGVAIWVGTKLGVPQRPAQAG